ncbi:MAG TPA: hypothetical protein VIJ38_14470 [Acidobacteriaceae bacterium]
MRDLLRRYQTGFQDLQPAVRFEEELDSTVTAVAGVYTGRAVVDPCGMTNQTRENFGD